MIKYITGIEGLRLTRSEIAPPDQTIARGHILLKTTAKLDERQAHVCHKNDVGGSELLRKHWLLEFQICTVQIYPTTSDSTDLLTISHRISSVILSYVAL